MSSNGKMQQGSFPSGEESCTIICFPCELAQTMFEQLWANSGRSLAHKDPELQILGTDGPPHPYKISGATQPTGTSRMMPSLSFINQDVLAGCGGAGKESKQMLVSCSQEVISGPKNFWKYRTQICKKVFYQRMPRGMCCAVSAHPDWCCASLLLFNLYS